MCFVFRKHFVCLCLCVCSCFEEAVGDSRGCGSVLIFRKTAKTAEKEPWHRKCCDTECVHHVLVYVEEEERIVMRENVRSHKQGTGWVRLFESGGVWCFRTQIYVGRIRWFSTSLWLSAPIPVSTLPCISSSPCAGCFSGDLDSLGCLTQSRLNFPDTAEIFFLTHIHLASVPHLGLRQGFSSNGKKAIHIPEPALCLDVC